MDDTEIVPASLDVACAELRDRHSKGVIAKVDYHRIRRALIPAGKLRPTSPEVRGIRAEGLESLDHIDHVLHETTRRALLAAITGLINSEEVGQ